MRIPILERPAAPTLVPTCRPRLLLRPAAFLKLTYLCHAADTEIGGFGLSNPIDPLIVEDVLLVKQTCTSVTVEFDDTAVADLIDAMADQEIPPQRCSRVWVHTHPGQSANPSGTDERTFARSFGGADFSVMLILARGGAMYARLQLIGSVKTAIEIPVIVDWSELPAYLENPALGEQVRQWHEELEQLVLRPLPIFEIELGEEAGVQRGTHFGSAIDREDWFDHLGMDENLLLTGEEGVDDHDYLY